MRHIEVPMDPDLRKLAEQDIGIDGAQSLMLVQIARDIANLQKKTDQLSSPIHQMQTAVTTEKEPTIRLTFVERL